MVSQNVNDIMQNALYLLTWLAQYSFITSACCNYDVKLIMWILQ